MNISKQIKKIWQFFSLQSDEMLIIPCYNSEKEADEFLVARMINGLIHIERKEKFPEVTHNMNFRILQRRDADGHFIIPSADEYKNKLNDDYIY